MSECILFYTYADTRKHEYFIDLIEDDLARERYREKLREVMTFAELSTCRKKYLLRYFGEELAGDNCGACDVCLANKFFEQSGDEGQNFDATVVAKKDPVGGGKAE